jgi:hypothetical protein
MIAIATAAPVPSSPTRLLLRGTAYDGWTRRRLCEELRIGRYFLGLDVLLAALVQLGLTDQVESAAQLKVDTAERGVIGGVAQVALPVEGLLDAQILVPCPDVPVLFFFRKQSAQAYR